MKKPLIVLCAALLFATFAACTDSTELASGNTVINITWTDAPETYEHACYLAVAKGTYSFGSASVPPSSAIVYNKSISSSITKRYLNLTDDGAYSAFVYYDKDDNGSLGSSDLQVGFAAFTSTSGAAVSLTAPY